MKHTSREITGGMEFDWEKWFGPKQTWSHTESLEGELERKDENFIPGAQPYLFAPIRAGGMDTSNQMMRLRLVLAHFPQASQVAQW